MSDEPDVVVVVVVVVRGSRAAPWTAITRARHRRDGLRFPSDLKGHGGGTVTRGYIHAGDAVFQAADRSAAATLRKLAGDGVAGVVEGPGAQRIAG